MTEPVSSKPILFRGQMVRAIIAGAKTQTRRAMKPQPPDWCTQFGYTVCTPHGSVSGGNDDLKAAGGPRERFFRSPYGVARDLLWVREKWCPAAEFLSQCTGPKDIRYAASVSEAEWATSKWRPSIHMPRWASRITLRITAVRVERLQRISEEDAIAEGIDESRCAELTTKSPWKGECAPVAVHAYAALWERINGPTSWAANPWVWAISFERINNDAKAVA